MQYKNGREVKLDDPFVHVNEDNNIVRDASGSFSVGHVGGVQKGSEIQLTVDEEHMKNCLHIADCEEHLKIREKLKNENKPKQS